VVVTTMSLKRLLFSVASVAPILAIACAAPASSPDGTSDEDNLTSLDPALEKAALANLKRIAREIDVQHLANYGSLPAATDPSFPDAVAKAFLAAVQLEYQAKPDLLKKRVESLASMVFFSAPQVTTDGHVGRLTPFHGMDDNAFNALIRAEDFVFSSHTQANGGSPNGVRPFSVCETKYLIQIATGKVTNPAFISFGGISNYDAYAQAYKTFASTCAPADLAEWYNFRGLGGLRPSWLESNYNDRVLRRMLKVCKSPTTDAAKAVCADFQKDRLAYRDKKNVGLALREMVYDTTASSTINGTQDGEYISNSSSPGIFVEDRNGDGIAEWIVPGPATLVPGAKLKLADNSQVTVSADGKGIVKGDHSTVAISSATVSIATATQFGANLKITLTFADNTTSTASAAPGAVTPIQRVDSRWKPELAKRADLGLSQLFADATGCEGNVADATTCPLEKRFYSMIDRHENFYQTYSSLDDSSSSVSSQPSPLVACSITLGASHVWDTAGTPTGGTAGFIYLMRIPFAQILSGDVRSVDTLGRLKGNLNAGPKVLTIQDVAAGHSQLDMSKVWLDIATLSHNAYQSEHEISKFGTVPAEQIEGVLVIRLPAAMQAAPPAAPSSAPAPADSNAPQDPPPVPGNDGGVSDAGHP
jgi:hypothetical protein